MIIAFVIINVELGKDKEALNALKELVEAKEAYMVYGIYDIITRIEAETMQELNDVIGKKIRRINNVRSTQTLIVM